MTEPNPAETPAKQSNRFDIFNDAELAMLSEALRELLQIKQEALQIVNVDLGNNPEPPFTECDFGIPSIVRMLDELHQAG